MNKSNKQATEISEVAIRIDNISKAFKLPHERQNSIKSLIVNGLSSKRNYELQHVLKDITFDVKKGEFFGIVGRNGSGKSTLLKCIAGVYTPDQGHIKVNGSLVPFIELGVGFNPELSGRDNVYLNGAILGFSRPKIDDMYQEIVNFAELEKFMDQKLKNFSSGMQVRLAFSIAIRAKSDILLLDEVLAVGDEAFQKKCIDIFEEYKASKRTIILVTHSMSTVEQYCDKAILLDNGQIKDMGDPRKIASEYLMLNTNKQKMEQNFDDEAFVKKHGVKYKIINKDTKKQDRKFKFGETVEIEISWESDLIKNIGIALIKNSGEYIYGPNTISDEINVKKTKKVVYRLKLNLAKGSYRFLFAFFGDNKFDRLHLIAKNLVFDIENKNQDWSGIIKLENEWET